MLPVATKVGNQVFLDLQVLHGGFPWLPAIVVTGSTGKVRLRTQEVICRSDFLERFKGQRKERMLPFTYLWGKPSNSCSDLSVSSSSGIELGRTSSPS